MKFITLSAELVEKRREGVFGNYSNELAWNWPRKHHLTGMH